MVRAFLWTTALARATDSLPADGASLVRLARVQRSRV